MNHCRYAPVVLSGAALVALCGSARGQSLPRQNVHDDSLGAPRIPLLPNADTDSDEMRVAPITVCFMPGTDPRYVAAVEALVKARNDALFAGLDYYIVARWAGTFGSPVNIRWSFVPDGVSLPGGAGEPTAPSTLFSTFDAGFSTQGGRATWINRFTQVFGRWAQLSGNTYQRIAVGGTDWDDGAAWGTAGATLSRGDVRIGSHPIDGEFNILAYNEFPTNGDMILDSQDIPLFADTTNANRFLRDCAMHEHGHGMGLAHSCSNTTKTLMNPFIDTSFDGPQQDDIRGMQALYGDINGLINTAPLAKDLGAIAPGVSFPATGVMGVTPPPVTGSADPNSGVISLDPNAQMDYYKVNATSPIALTVVATPIGSTYQNAAQANDGSCPTTGTTNALAAADLTITVYSSNGTTQVATSNAAGAGATESITDLILNTTGVYYIKIGAASGSLTGTQAYTLRISATATQAAPQFTTNPQPADHYCIGDPITLSVAASGLPAPAYQWRKNTVPIQGKTSTTLSIPTTTSDDAGVYDCVATNASGSVPSAPATISFSNITITQQPKSVTTPEGSSVTFSVTTSGGAPTGYQWKQNGQPIFLANAATFTFTSEAGDEGSYTCDITGPCGTITSNPATLTFGVPACYANCDGSTTAPLLTSGDFICYLDRFRAGDPYANCDGSTIVPVLNVSDFVCFLGKFRAGCQ
jgi:hypothetical protein